MNLRYFVGGINGVGKTTLLKKIAEAQPEFVVVKGSECFMDWLGIPNDYDALRSLSAETKRGEWQNCLFQLLEDVETAGQDLLLDAHYLNPVNGKISVVTDTWLEAFDTAVLVTAPAEQVYERIQRDERQRALFGDRADELAVIQSYLQATEEHYRRCLPAYDLAGLELSHPDGGTDQAVHHFLDFDRDLRDF